ncbi:hypothetical protein SAMN04488589_0238 [Methanolobus vulcani]|jgi:hypothetical protein|uniref:Polyprenyl synthetase n=1 Tax=Methanolobus vulcani TaxID=38026 RepID=A0A7Z7FBP4_9EURY|nr:DUF116 domain-containing protein [Methanolobus vulcani]MDK2825448.1 uncharacterized protein [Methanolobus sp.]MDK2947029.1 uncharacterized protein [Methanolobus sp.]SDF28761.1 hypothetical protein SAMN04488589_0238 [Methanolobus vulcani]
MYRVIGIIVTLLLIISFLLAAIALLVSRISLNRHVWLAGFFAGILDFFYMPLKYFFYKFSDPRILDKWMVSLKNISNRNSFKKTNKRMIIAPHCMRAMDCPASSKRTGIQCIKCGKCVFSQLKIDAPKYGYDLYIVTGSSFVKHVLKEKNYDAALLIACDYELNKVMMGLKGKKIVTYGIPMLNDGCFNTKVDYDKVIETLKILSS